MYDKNIRKIMIITRREKFNSQESCILSIRNRGCLCFWHRENKRYQIVACATIALLLHFLFLYAFAWMLMEGTHIIVMLVQVFDATKSRLKYYYLIGYGFHKLFNHYI